ncbi:MAG: hypothetical protein D6737_07190, partial [Chloroflexi bacterium]
HYLACCPVAELSYTPLAGAFFIFRKPQPPIRPTGRGQRSAANEVRPTKCGQQGVGEQMFNQ